LSPAGRPKKSRAKPILIRGSTLKKFWIKNKSLTPTLSPWQGERIKVRGSGKKYALIRGEDAPRLRSDPPIESGDDMAGESGEDINKCIREEFSKEKKAANQGGLF
jgi:hypothetical protein